MASPKEVADMKKMLQQPFLKFNASTDSYADKLVPAQYHVNGLMPGFAESRRSYSSELEEIMKPRPYAKIKYKVVQEANNKVSMLPIVETDSSQVVNPTKKEQTLIGCDQALLCQPRIPSTQSCPVGLSSSTVPFSTSQSSHVPFAEVSPIEYLVVEPDIIFDTSYTVPDISKETSEELVKIGPIWDGLDVIAVDKGKHDLCYSSNLLTNLKVRVEDVDLFIQNAMKTYYNLANQFTAAYLESDVAHCYVNIRKVPVLHSDSDEDLSSMVDLQTWQNEMNKALEEFGGED